MVHPMINGIQNFSTYDPYSSMRMGNPADPAVKTATGETIDPRTGETINPRTVKVEPSGECQTCKNRKYQDGSDENVSFKSATHLSPQAAAGAVRAHEGEHVANAYTKAAENNGKVIRASVTIHTAVCPECGRTYVSGGVTNTLIKYSNEDNPYVKNLKAQQAEDLKGRNIDYAA